MSEFKLKPEPVWGRTGIVLLATLALAPFQGVLGGILPPPPPATPVHEQIIELEGDYSGLADQEVGLGPQFGHSVAMHGNTLVVGAPRTRVYVAGDEPGSAVAVHLGAVFVFRWNGYQWLPTQRLIPAQSVINTDAECGYSVAVSRFNLLVGCPYHVDGDTQQERGRTLVFQRSQETGDFQFATTFDDTLATNGAECGHSVALLDAVDSGALPLAVVGCPGRQQLISGQIFSGGVDVYHWLLNWGHAVSLTGNPGSTSRMGHGVSLNTHAESILLATGAPGFSNNAGQVRIFEMGETSASWTLEASYTGTTSSRLGYSVDLGGERMVAGAPTRTALVFDPDDGFVNVPVGGISVVTRSCTFNPFPDPPTCTWGEATAIDGSPTQGTEPQNRLGHAVHVLATGASGRIIAGEPHYALGSVSANGRPGRARHYLRNGASWELNTGEPFYQIPATWSYQEAGAALAGDSGWVAVGAPLAYLSKIGPGLGRVRLYAYNNSLFSDRFEND